MKYKVGDRVNVVDRSWAFGITDGIYTSISYIPMKNLTVVTVGLKVLGNAYGTKSGNYSEICDLLVTNGKGDFYFVLSRLCRPVDKVIEVRYFLDGIDVTDKISDETKQGVHSIARG